MPSTRKLKVFLCHASEDKPKVRELYTKLATKPWIQPWSDEDILSGQDRKEEIQKTIDIASVILVCLSNISVNQEGYIQTEIKFALDKADEKPFETIFIIPLRLDDCELPRKLNKWKCLDYFDDLYYNELIKALRYKAEKLGIDIDSDDEDDVIKTTQNNNLYSYIYIPHRITSSVSHPFYISKYPVTNYQFERFINSPTFSDPRYWSNFPKFGSERSTNKYWEQNGVNWLKQQFKGYEDFPPNGLIERGNLKEKIWKYWNHPNLGRQKPTNPVVGINWYVANAYCKWLQHNWLEIEEGRMNRNLSPIDIRLPLESEWILAAGGKNPSYRYPWDDPDDFKKNLSGRINQNPIVRKLLSWILRNQREKNNDYQKKIIARSNVKESLIQNTTSVDAYPNGASPYGVMDMSGNTWEFVADFVKGIVPLHGGSWKDQMIEARVGYLESYIFSWDKRWDNVGFRLVISQWQ